MENIGHNPYYDLVMDEDLATNEWPRKADTMKANGTCCLAVKVLQKNEFDANKTTKTNIGKWTLARAINTGIMNSTSFVGCHAGDSESYKVFGDVLFNKVISEYHNGYNVRTQIHNSDTDINKLTNQWNSRVQNKILSTRIRVARNIKSFPLNPGGSLESRLAIVEVMERVFKSMDEDLAGTFYHHSKMTSFEQQELINNHFLFRGGDKMQAASGYHQYWPHGRGIFVSKNKQFLVWVNEGDHLRIISMEKGHDIKSAFTRLIKGVKAIENRLKIELRITQVFKHTNSHGYITCCPTNLGTAMRASIYMLKPKLVQFVEFEKLDNFARKRGCQIRGSNGEHSKVTDTIDISNSHRLGITEVELIQKMITFANELLDIEDTIQDRTS